MFTPPLQNGLSIKKPRNSNLELYRVICMLMIVAHHFVVNSGLGGSLGPLLVYPDSTKTLFLRLFGMWGKTGINCFLMITGYYMCTSKITLKKYLKVFLEVFFYNIVIFAVFLSIGYESFNLRSIVKSVLPIWGFDKMFTSCFLAFYLFIPFLALLVQNLSKQQHFFLIVLLLSCYTVLGSIPGFDVSFNYITWFCIIFIIASYIRLHPISIFERKALWGWLTLGFVGLAMMSVVLLPKIIGSNYFLVSDSNKLFAVVVAVSSFLWFKNINIRQSKIINALGASTFGVLLIHANSNAMRTWLWKDTVDVVGHYNLPLGQLVLFSVGVVLAIFLVCNLIDQLRIATIEKWFFNLYDRKISDKTDVFVNKIKMIGKKICQKNKLQ